MVLAGGLEAIQDPLLEMPKTCESSWEVHKFGGASLANAGLYRTVGDLLISESEGREGETGGKVPTMAIVSAMYGFTDLLVGAVEAAIVSQDDAEAKIDDVVDKQIATIRELAPPEIAAPFETNIKEDAIKVKGVIAALKLIRSVPDVVMELVTGLGEVWSAQTLLAYLKTKGVPCDWIDAREVLVVDSKSSGLGEKGSSSTGGVTVQWEESASRMNEWWKTKGAGFTELDYSVEVPIVIVTGFVASNLQGVPTTLKRSGSDYSATIFARLLSAERVTMWKNTDGVYTADPRRVPDAFPIPSLKYDEAMELAYFGAQVLHPSAMVPCMDAEIPVYVRNIFNPSFKGSVIRGRCATLEDRDKIAMESTDPTFQTKRGVSIPIKGITSIDKVAILNLEGASLVGLPGVASRFFGALGQANVNIIMITQASSEHSICVVVPEEQGDVALAALRAAFELELSRASINSVSLLKGMSVVAIIGEGMAFTPGVSATFMRALFSAGVNIRAIAQGSSERQVSAVVTREDVTRALRSVHGAFTLSGKVCSVAVLGCSGKVGTEFLKQLHANTDRVSDLTDLRTRLIVAADSQKMVYEERGMNPDHAQKMVSEGEELDMDKITSLMAHDINPTRVIVDLTDSDEVAGKYEDWLSKGIQVVTASKAVGAGPYDRFKRTSVAAISAGSQWAAECSVGAALPLLNTIRDLSYTGDQIKAVEGVFSGTVTFLASSMESGTSFADALKNAFDKGFTEPDPRNDLNGMDVARKLVILGRELGMECSVEDVEIESVIPSDLAEWEPTTRKDLVPELVEKIKGGAGKEFEERVMKAHKEGKRIRQVGVVNVSEGTLKVEVLEVDAHSRYGQLLESDNAICITSNRYCSQPLVIQGAGAGSVLTASAVYADVLRVSRTN